MTVLASQGSLALFIDRHRTHRSRGHHAAVHRQAGHKHLEELGNGLSRGGAFLNVVAKGLHGAATPGVSFLTGPILNRPTCACNLKVSSI